MCGDKQQSNGQAAPPFFGSHSPRTRATKKGRRHEQRGAVAHSGQDIPKQGMLPFGLLDVPSDSSAAVPSDMAAGPIPTALTPPVLLAPDPGSSSLGTGICNLSHTLNYEHVPAPQPGPETSAHLSASLDLGPPEAAQRQSALATLRAEPAPEVAASSKSPESLVSPTSRILDGFSTGIGQDAAPSGQALSLVTWYLLLPLLRALRDAAEEGSSAK